MCAGCRRVSVPVCDLPAGRRACAVFVRCFIVVGGVAYAYCPILVRRVHLRVGLGRHCLCARCRRASVLVCDLPAWRCACAVFVRCSIVVGGVAYVYCPILVRHVHLRVWLGRLCLCARCRRASVLVCDLPARMCACAVFARCSIVVGGVAYVYCPILVRHVHLRVWLW